MWCNVFLPTLHILHLKWDPSHDNGEAAKILPSRSGGKLSAQTKDTQMRNLTRIRGRGTGLGAALSIAAITATSLVLAQPQGGPPPGGQGGPGGPGGPGGQGRFGPPPGGPGFPGMGPG